MHRQRLAEQQINQATKQGQGFKEQNILLIITTKIV